VDGKKVTFFVSKNNYLVTIISLTYWLMISTSNVVWWNKNVKSMLQGSKKQECGHDKWGLGVILSNHKWISP